MAVFLHNFSCRTPQLPNLEQLIPNISDMQIYPQIIFIGHQKNIYMNLFVFYQVGFETSVINNILDLLMEECILQLRSIIKRFKLGIYLSNTNIWGNFWPKFVCLTPVVPIYRVTPHYFTINSEEIPSWFCPECIFVVTLYYQIIPIGSLFA